MDWQSRRLNQRRPLLNLKRAQSRRSLFGLISLLVIAGMLVFTGGILSGRFSLASLYKSNTPPKVQVFQKTDSDSNRPKSLTKDTLARLIGPRSFNEDELNAFEIKNKTGEDLFVNTTLIPELQKWAVKTISRTRAHSAALVILNPDRGDVLAMASYTDNHQPVNLVLRSSFPAASLFKIVTAAAAVETANLNCSSILAYNGRKYTLYRKQLRTDVRSGRNRVTLQESFAKSINVVFGKLGAYLLSPDVLKEFARRFYFNKPIPFELPVQPSRFKPPDSDSFHLAEAASGFNRTTMLSPLHGALIAAAMVKDGLIVEPTVVREVFNRNNNIYYRHQTAYLGRAISTETARELKRMMRATITKGTGRPFFRRRRAQAILSKLEIGGKSGSINDNQGRRVDWFISFAVKKGSHDKIALAAVVVHHRDKLGLRAQAIVRDSIIHYFGPHLRADKKSNATRG